MAVIVLRIDTQNGTIVADGALEREVEKWIGYADRSPKPFVEYTIGGCMMLDAWRLAVVDQKVDPDRLTLVDESGDKWLFDKNGRTWKTYEGGHPPRQDYPFELRQPQSDMLHRLMKKMLEEHKASQGSGAESPRGTKTLINQ